MSHYDVIIIGTGAGGGTLALERMSVTVPAAIATPAHS
jgi:choline dehydrogenase-like flavoprotein